MARHQASDHYGCGSKILRQVGELFNPASRVRFLTNDDIFQKGYRSHIVVFKGRGKTSGSYPSCTMPHGAISDESAAGRLSPKPLRFVPYDPNRKNSRKQRRPNGEGLRGSGATRSDSASRLDADTPLETRGPREGAAVVDGGQSGQDVDGFSNASAPSFIGEYAFRLRSMRTADVSSKASGTRRWVLGSCRMKLGPRMNKYLSEKRLRTEVSLQPAQRNTVRREYRIMIRRLGAGISHRRRQQRTTSFETPANSISLSGR